MKISIIGAGPAGCFTAYLLAKHGFDVSVYEQKSKIGKIQCGGGLTPSIEKVDAMFRTKEFKKTIVNRIASNIFRSLNNSLEIKFKHPEYVVNRIKFDNFIADKARKAGAKINLRSKFIRIKEKRQKIKFIIKQNDKEIEKETDILIGADGALSQVCKCIGIKKNLVLAIEARCIGKFKRNVYEIFLGKEYGKLYAWIIPESSSIARVGLFEEYNKFKHLIKKLNAKILDMRSGYISIDKPIKCYCGKNVYLVGDAACQVKASTGGGIIPSLIGAKILAKSIINKESFEKNLKKFKRDLYLHYIIRKVLNKLSDSDYDKLLEMIKNDSKIKKFLEESSRDEISFSKIPFRAKFLRYAKKII
ncbi:NAD(P)/FAD-dependent oxidoreductase [Candidatus Pacearchaeota archaeon]|nr:NAD(P)/FAD-dependent oxidoreductase [Candidatus Pacearchaeota archaeon]